MTWPDWLLPEIREARVRDSFAGFLWPEPEPEPPLTGDELLSEVRWLLDGNMHPLEVANAVGKSPQTVYRAAWRAGDVRVSSVFAGHSKTTKKRKKEMA